MKISIDTTDLTKNVQVFEGLAAATRQQKTRLLTRSIIAVERETKKRARSGGAFSTRSTGMLARKLGWKVEADGSAVITTGVVYGKIQEFGGVTKPHAIVAKSSPYRTEFSMRKGKMVGIRERGKTGGVLAFKVGGAMVFAKSVKHPGSKIPGTHYTRDSFEKVKPAIIEDAAQMMSSINGGPKWP